MDFRLHNVSKYFNVKRLYLNLFKRSTSDVPPPVEKRFRKIFNHPVDVEWMVTGSDFEALFYEKKQERIARFDKSGNLLEVRTNITPLDSALIANEGVRQMGELMNYIQISRGDITTHELIIRKPDLTRILVLLNNDFEVIREETL